MNERSTVPQNRAAFVELRQRKRHSSRRTQRLWYLAAHFNRTCTRLTSFGGSLTLLFQRSMRMNFSTPNLRSLAISGARLRTISSKVLRIYSRLLAMRGSNLSNYTKEEDMLISDVHQSLDWKFLPLIQPGLLPQSIHRERRSTHSHPSSLTLGT